MNRRAELPRQLWDVPFSRQDATSLGVNGGRLRAHDLERPFHGVYRVRSGAEHHLWRCLSYQKRMNPDHCFSHHTAAQLYGLPLPLYAVEDRRIHVAAPSPGRAPAGAGVIGHRFDSSRWSQRELLLRDNDSDQLFALAIASPEFVWAQLAETLDVGDLIALGDAIVGGSINPDIRGDGPLASRADLQGAVDQHRGCRGAKTMVSAIHGIRVGSLSRPESLLRWMLMRAGLPEPLPNIPAHDPRGQLISTPDLCWPDFRVLIEYQGDGHRTARGKFRSDISRMNDYVDGGWSAIQSSADDVFGNPNPLAERAWRRLVAGGWNPKRRQLRHIAGARP